METELENLTNHSSVSQHGGRREGAGRKPGSENEETRQRRIAERDYKMRVVTHIHDLFNSQLALAKGLTFMYRIDEEKNEDGKVLKRKHVIVENPEEVRDILDGLDGAESGVVDDNYYYITTKIPDIKAIDSMLDRVFGRPKQSIGLEDPDGNALTFLVAEVIAKKNTIGDGNTDSEAK